MMLLRQRSVELVHNAQPFNLIGVDYQRQLVGRPRGPVKLDVIDLLVRRNMPNILLSHNPNTFPSAAELGIELMLTGHTHGGQVRVEILDHYFSPAEFLTPYVAGMYVRPLHSSTSLRDAEAWHAKPKAPPSVVYVNRGLGTIGAPVRLGVPPRSRCTRSVESSPQALGIETRYDSGRCLSSTGRLKRFKPFHSDFGYSASPRDTP